MCMPVKLLHAYQAPVLVIVHAIVGAVYQSKHEHKDVQLYLDWSHSEISGPVLVLILLLSIFVHCLFYGIYRVRIYIYKQCSSSEKEIPDHASNVDNVQRHATATDVILDEIKSQDFVDITPYIKDDIGLRNSMCKDSPATRVNRLFKSESDLSEYRTRNGLYCEFLNNDVVLHSRRMSDGLYAMSTEQLRPSSRVTIIQVQKCNDTENGDANDDNFETQSDCFTTTSLSSYSYDDRYL